VAFKEALYKQRELALKHKSEADNLKTTRDAAVKAKNARLAQKRAQRAVAQEQAQARRHAKIANEHRGGAPGPVKQATVEDDLSWDQLEDQAEAQAENKASYIEAQATAKAEQKPKAKHGKPTARTARAMWDDGVDERLVGDAGLKSRWNKSLLSGGR